MKTLSTTHKEITLKIIAGVIAALFFYAAISKLIDYDKARREMLNQVFPKNVSEVLAWLVPAAELLLIPLLIYTPTRPKGLWISLGLLTAFTGYIAVVMTGIFGRVPCSCGGILEQLSYGMHLLFNLFFMLVAFMGIAIEKGWLVNKRWFHFLKQRKGVARHSG